VESLLWSFALLGVAILFFTLEMFLPSGGILALFSVLSMVAAIVVGFMIGFRPGMTITLITLILVPLSAAAAIRVWPKTPIGRMMIARAPAGDAEVLPLEGRQERAALIGKIGVSITKMLPSGEVEIDGESYDAVTSGMAVDPGQIIEVIDVRANRIVVKPSRRTLGAERTLLEQSFEDLGFNDMNDDKADDAV
jgi:membrane-bound ClpP family serine protease